MNITNANGRRRTGVEDMDARIRPVHRACLSMGKETARWDNEVACRDLFSWSSEKRTGE